MPRSNLGARLRLEPLEARAVPAGLPFAGGDIIVTKSELGSPGHFFREYQPDGTLVRQVDIPDVDGTYSRDVAVTPAGQLVVYNGTFNPSLSVYDPVAETWTHHTYPGWNTANNLTYGGVAVSGRYAFATDTFTYNGGEPSGIVRFDLTDGSAQRFADGTDYTDVYLGKDGKLYGLKGYGGIDVFNPATMAKLGTVPLTGPAGGDVRALAVNAAGELYLAVWNHDVYHVAADGTILDHLDMNTLPPAGVVGGSWSVDVTPDGREVLLVCGSGYLVRTDPDLSNPRIFNPQMDAPYSFGAYVPLPTVSAGPDRTIAEGDFVRFRATPAGGAAPYQYAWDFGDGTSATGPAVRHQYRDDGTYTVTLTLRDAAGAVATDTAVVTALNRPPRGAIMGPARSVPSWERTFTFTGSDPGLDDRDALEYRIDWGDGQTETLTGGTKVQGAHAYAAAGTYTVRLVVADPDGSTSPEYRRQVTVLPALSAGGVLYVAGTADDDVIVLLAGNSGGPAVRVAVNGTVVASGSPAAVTVFAREGDDTVATVGPVRTRLVLVGGAGDDRLDARSAVAPTVLTGGAGDDALTGGAGRDVLVGGAGADELDGGGNQDVAIGDGLVLEADPTALRRLSLEWARTDARYETRRDRLLGLVSGGMNGTYTLTGGWLTADATADVLTGGAGRDWFFAGTPAADELRDPAADETVTGL